MWLCLQGKTPAVQVALDLYNILSEGDTNLRQPVALEDQLLQDQQMDTEVGKSMVQLLQVGSMHTTCAICLSLHTCPLITLSLPFCFALCMRLTVPFLLRLKWHACLVNS